MEYPDRDELVVVKVTQVLNYGVFVELIEFNNKRGFVHISNVSSSWVKNIRNLVKMNQVRVAKVLNVDKEKKQIDVSFAGISPQMERTKMNTFKQENREEKLVLILAKQEKKDFDTVWNEVAEPLIEEFGSLYDAFEKIASGTDTTNILNKNWVKPVQEMVEKNIVVTKKSVKGIINIKTIQDNGLELIQKLFETTNTKNIELLYNCAGTYTITSSAPTFKEAENNLNKIIETLEKNAKKQGMNFSFKMNNEKKNK